MPAQEIVTRVCDALRDCEPDAVAIPGWSDKGALAAVLWCRRTKTPAILMSESSAHDERRTSWKEFLKRGLLQCYSAALVGGSLHKSYLEKLGFPSKRIFCGYDVVDNSYFACEAAKAREQKSEMLAKYSLPETYFLASARFIEKKNLSMLLRSYAKYREAAGPKALKLILLGDGPLRQQLEGERAALHVEEAVMMPGFKQYVDLPAYYAFARAFIHPSTTEQWGLVVNEAIATGLPVIVSSRCGCVPELVRENFNGFTFDPDDTDSLASLFDRVSSLPTEEWERLSLGSRDIASQNGPERFAEGLKNAVETALEFPPIRSTLLQRILLNSLLCR